jgi:hypothetical protein
MDLGRQFQVSAIGAAETSLRCSAGGAHLAPERDHDPDPCSDLSPGFVFTLTCLAHPPEM